MSPSMPTTQATDTAATANLAPSVLSDAERQQLIARWQSIKATLPPSVTLLAVSKTKPSEMIRALAAEGQADFGENYAQEAIGKILELSDVSVNGQPLVWHYIGHVQRNKTKDLAAHFDWVHGVDRLIIAQRLSEQRGRTLPPLNICLQVNIDDEHSKSGCTLAEVPNLVHQISQLPHLRLRGLMIIPAKDSTTAFSQTKQLFEDNRSQHHNPADWDTLSMGMSTDLQAAIAAGATMVRVGTAIFGARDYH